jgi:NTE family protein
MATDVTHGRLLRLPWDYGRFGLDPDEQLVADAVRMSLSIPFYFEPCTLRNPATAKRPPSSTAVCCPTSRSRSSTALVGNDQTHLDRPGVRERTMTVDTRAPRSPTSTSTTSTGKA